MGFVIAILITLAIMGSVLWVMPSPRDQAITKLRQQAMRKGMKVRLLDEHLRVKLFPWLADKRSYVLYEMPFALKGKGQESRTCVLRLVGRDTIHELDRDIETHDYIEYHDLLGRVPKSTEAIAFYGGGVALLWRESVGENDIDLIESVLKHCADQPPWEGVRKTI